MHLLTKSDQTRCDTTVRLQLRYKNCNSSDNTSHRRIREVLTLAGRNAVEMSKSQVDVRTNRRVPSHKVRWSEHHIKRCSTVGVRLSMTEADSSREVSDTKYVWVRSPCNVHDVVIPRGIVHL